MLYINIYIYIRGQKNLDVTIPEHKVGAKMSKKQREKNFKKNARLPGCGGLAHPLSTSPSPRLGRRWWMNPITIIIFEYIRHAQYLVYTSVYIPGIYIYNYVSPRIPCGGRCIVSSSRPDPRAWVDATPGRRGPKTSLRGLSSSSRRSRRRRRCYSSPFLRPVSRSFFSPFNSQEMNIDWQVPCVGARGGVSAIVVAGTSSQHRWPSFAVLVVLCLRGISRRRRPRVVCLPWSSLPPTQESPFVYVAG